ILVPQPSSLVSRELRPKMGRDARNSRAFCIHSEPETGQFSNFCRAVSEFSLTGIFVVPSGVPDISRFGDREHVIARSSCQKCGLLRPIKLRTVVRFEPITGPSH